MTTPPPDYIIGTGRPLGVLEPHQDDWLLWGGSIGGHHNSVNRPVHIIPASLGGTSQVLDVLRGEKFSSYWQHISGANGWHYPVREGIPYLMQDEFSAARDRELIAASAQLGTPRGNIHFELGPARDQSISVANAKLKILAFKELHPGAGIYTTWWGDSDPTHAACGEALRQLRIDDPTNFDDVRWVVRTDQITYAQSRQTVESFTATAYTVPTAYATQVQAMVWRACQAYGAWLPSLAYGEGSYGIGFHSVYSYFQGVMNGQANWLIKPVGW